MRRKFMTYAAVSVVTFSVLTGCHAGQTVKSGTATVPANSSPAIQSPVQSPVQSPAIQSPLATSPPLPEGAERGFVFTDENGIAIRGADPVAYFTEGQPVIGSSEFAYTWKGATWHFASAANRDRFAANPEQYAPQYGGYCAFAVANNYTASTIPEAWSIVDNKLYLNFDLRIRDRWERDIPGNIARGNANWPEALRDFRR